MSEVAVRMEHVYKKFRKGETFNSLRDLMPALTGKMSFEVMAGECFGIIGHNGAGKSTALKLLSRIMKPTTGKMTVKGRLSALIEVSAGFHQDLTGRENIFLNGSILGMNKREIQSKIDQIIDFSGIEEFIDTPVKRYSSGMYARLGFSVASHVDPDVLIVDEVLSVGDSAFQQKCLERMREVVRGGAAVLFVSHNLKVVAEFCHRCLLLEKGQTAQVGKPQEVISTYLQAASGRQAANDGLGPVRISSVRVCDENGDCMRFRPGQRAWIDIELTAVTRCNKVSVTLYMVDEKFTHVFDTSTERLGHATVDLEEGDVYSCTFELQLNLAEGAFYPSVVLYRYDIQKVYDRWEPASTIYISSEGGVRGIAHCFPRLCRQEIRQVSEVAPAQL
jgi:lipopolysaccharide transport system ATP-binding protein